MRRIAMLAFLACLAVTPFGISSPKEGNWADRLKVKKNDGWKTTKSFRAGERACVLAIGDHEGEIPNLHLTIYDKNGALVAEDKGGGTLVGDCVAVFWYPPRDGEYRIEVSNPGANDHTCYLAIK